MQGLDALCDFMIDNFENVAQLCSCIPRQWLRETSLGLFQYVALAFKFRICHRTIYGNSIQLCA